jgi:HD-GYP domain-containing protein (c-di-GMP phosphodiesterase class II)
MEEKKHIIDAFTEMAPRYHLFQMLQRVSQAVSLEIDLDKLMGNVLDEVTGILHIERAAFFIKQSKSGKYALVAGEGINLPNMTTLRRDHPLVGRIAKEQRLLTWSDIETMHWFKSRGKVEAAVFKALGAELFLPLRAKGDLVGIFMLGPKLSDQPYTQLEQMMLITLSNQTAVAIQNAQLFSLVQKELVERRRAEKSLQLQSKRLSALQSINIAITTHFDMQIPLQMLLEQVISELKVDAADVLLLDEETQMLEYVAGRGFYTDALKFTRLGLGKGLAGQAAKIKSVFYVKDLAKEATSLRESPLLREEQFVAYYGVPLVARDQIKGVLEIFHRSPLQPDQEWMDYLNTLASETAIVVDNAQLFKDLEKTNIDLATAYESTLEGWARTLEMRDRETEGHSQRVLKLTLELAKRMGINGDEIIHLRRGTLLHDIGKIGIPDNILSKPGPLTKKEWRIMRHHPVYAYEMLSFIPFLAPALDIPYSHHEKWDGSGYPQSLKGEEIPLSARIFTIVDVWDALRSERPYREAWTDKDALSFIKEQSGKHFDPRVVKEFLAMIEVG